MTANVSKPITRSVRVNGIALTYYEWRAKPGNHEPPLVITHATGFHGRCYGAIADCFPDRRVIALDLRGHGRSEGGPVEDWSIIASDIAGFLDQLRIRRATGMGHSMGAHTLLQAAADRPEAFAHLVLFDPVIFSPAFYANNPDRDGPHPAIRRKRDFASPKAMMERFAERDPYRVFVPRVFEDYCRYGLIERTGGDYVLACTPEMEASVYASSYNNPGILKAAQSVQIPVTVVRAQQAEEFNFKNSPTWSGLASIIPQGRDLHRPDRTHFHPFEDPEDAARIIAEAERG